MIENSLQWNSALSTMNKKERASIFNLRKSELLELINHSDDFRNVVQYLNQDQRNELIEGKKEWLFQAVNNLHDVENIFPFVNNMQSADRAEFFTHCISRLLPSIQSIPDFQAFCKRLPLPQKIELISLVRDSFPLFIKNNLSFWTVFVGLRAEVRSHFIETVADFIPLWFQNIPQLIVLKKMNMEQRIIFFEAIKDKLVNLPIEKIYEYIKIIELIKVEQQDILLDKTLNNVVNFLKKAEKFKHLLCSLELEQRSMVFSAMRNKLIASCIKKAIHFAYVLTYINPTERDTLFLDMQDTVIGFIQTAYDLHYILEYLNEERRAFVFERIKHKLPSMVYNADTFNNVFEFLNKDQKEFAFNLLLEKALFFLDNLADIKDILEFLLPEQQTLFISKIQEKIFSLIHKYKFDNVPLSFKIIAPYLTPVQRADIFVRSKKEILNPMNGIRYIIGLLPFLQPEHQDTVWKHIRHRGLRSKEQEYCNLSDLIAPLDYAFSSRPELFTFLKNILPNFITDNYDLEEVLATLSEEEQCAFVHNFKEYPFTLSASFSFERALRKMSPPVQDYFLRAMASTIPSKMKDLNTIIRWMGLLKTHEQCILIEIIPQQILKFVKHSNSFRNLLLPLESEVRTKLFNLCFEQLLQNVKTTYALRSILEVLDDKQSRIFCKRLRDNSTNLDNDLRKAINDIVPYYHYPNFLSTMGVRQKKTSPNAIAHAIWLSAKRQDERKALKQSYTLWATQNKAALFDQEIDNALNQYQDI